MSDLQCLTHISLGFTNDSAEYTTKIETQQWESNMTTLAQPHETSITDVEVVIKCQATNTATSQRAAPLTAFSVARSQLRWPCRNAHFDPLEGAPLQKTNGRDKPPMLCHLHPYLHN